MGDLLMLAMFWAEGGFSAGWRIDCTRRARLALAGRVTDV
jgi:hypothetical protein